MAKTVYSPGDVLTADDANDFCQEGEVTNSSLNTAAGQPGGAWQTFTPVVTTGTHTGAKVGRYLQVGKTVDFIIQLTWATGDNFTDLVVNLPVTAQTNILGAQINVKFVDGLLSYMGDCLVTTTAITVFAARDAGTYIDSIRPTNAIPFTWGVGDVVQIAGRYEAA